MIISTLAGGVGTLSLNAKEPVGSAKPAAQSSVSAEPAEEPLTRLHEAAETLWNAYAPEEIKAEFELLGPQELQAFFQRIEQAAQQEDLARFAAFAPETRAAITALGVLPDFADYADWLRERLDDMEAAREAGMPPAAVPTPVPPPVPIPSIRPEKPVKPGVPRVPGKPSPPKLNVPLYELWVGRIGRRPPPGGAQALLPVVRAAFAAEGVPEALVWLAETESSFNPRVRSPVGARGLFQLMPETAKSLGLSLSPGDQRTHPQASARAAAAYLKKLHTRFGDWPLALAAYNGGEGRVSRILKARGAKDFAGIAEHLPAETRLYVPKVLATVRVRAGVAPEDLVAPTKGASLLPATTPAPRG